MNELARAEKSPISTIGKLNLIFGVYGGNILYSIYLDYADKLQDPEEYTRFSIDEDGFLPIAYSTISQYMGIPKDTVIKTIAKFVKRGLLQKKPGTKETYNIPLYRPESKSSVFIEIAEEKLKNLTTDRLDRSLNKKCIPEIISTLEKDPCVLVALGLVNRTKLEEFLDKLNSAKKVTDTNELQETKSPQESKLPKEKQEKQEKAKTSNVINLPPTNNQSRAVRLSNYFADVYKKYREQTYNVTNEDIELLTNAIAKYEYSDTTWEEIIDTFCARFENIYKHTNRNVDTTISEVVPDISKLVQEKTIDCIFKYYDRFIKSVIC